MICTLRKTPWKAFVLISMLAGCGGTNTGNDSGTNDADGGFDECVVDNSRMRPAKDPDWQLVPDGENSTGTICPASDVDHYWFTISQPGTIITVELANNVVRSEVDLCYKILPEDENAPVIAIVCDYDGTDGQTQLLGRHYLAEAGTYFLEVYDSGGDDEDTRNPYAIGLTQVVDPDQNESNNDKEHATPLSAAADGYLSFLEDQDWFAIQVNSQGQILSLDLTTQAASSVDLRYTVFMPDGSTPINTGLNANGDDGPTNLHDVLALGDAGTYYIMIQDENNDDSDLEVGYHLAVSLRSNPDSRDLGSNNDSPENATPITSGSPVSDAYVATRADQDWYKLQSPGVTDSNPALLEIDVAFSSDSPVDPAVDLVVGDPNTSCSPGDDCNLLNWSCGGGSCNTAACMNSQCPSHECVEHENKCSGAGFCLPEGGCGIRHLVMHGADWSTSGNPRHLHTVAPMYGSTYYILVRDFMGDDLDPDHAYSLTVTVHEELDTHERPPNGLYLPYATQEQDEDSRRWNIPLATPIHCGDVGDHIECDPIQGYLSFRGDQDWYVLDAIPAEAEATPDQQSTKVDYDLQFEYSFAGNADLFINYEFFLGGSIERPRIAFNHQGPVSDVMGDDECAYLCGEFHGSRPVYIRVQHSDRKKWDYEHPYNLVVKAYRRCPLTCEYCQPDATDYACPTPDNPCPRGGC